MTTLEHRFEGRQATARAIQAHVNRHLDATRRLRRIEVRLSSAVPVPTEPEDLRRLLAGLLSEQGQGRVELSLRRFERPLDNAGGEHLVRMIFEDAPATPAAPTRLRWWQRLFGSQPVRQVTEAPRDVAGIPARRAAEMLREALAAALRYDTAGLQGRPVAHVGISAHLPEIDATLRQMMPPLDPQAVQSVAAMLRRMDVSCQPDLRLDYRFEPRLNAEGTLAVLDADLRVRLSPAGASAGATAMPNVAGMQSTALPDAEQLAALRAPARGLRVRVLGTLASDFATPFEMTLKGWPARLDRAALEAAGFGREHGALLGVASQSCPLLIDRHGAQGLLLRPARRADAAPMYYGADDLQPLPAELVVSELTMQLVLNCPAGVRDAVTGTALPALRIELDVI